MLLLTAEKLAPARVGFLSAPAFALKENGFVRTENSKVNKEREHLEEACGQEGGEHVILFFQR